jgi:hypothetical protein
VGRGAAEAFPQAIEAVGANPPGTFFENWYRMIGSGAQRDTSTNLFVKPLEVDYIV